MGVLLLAGQRGGVLMLANNTEYRTIREASSGQAHNNNAALVIGFVLGTRTISRRDSDWQANKARRPSPRQCGHVTLHRACCWRCREPPCVAKCLMQRMKHCLCAPIAPIARARTQVPLHYSRIPLAARSHSLRAFALQHTLQSLDTPPLARSPCSP